MPAYTTVVTHATGDVLPATDWNTYLRDNLAFMHDMGADLASAATITPTNQFHRVTGTTTITAFTAPSGTGQGGNRLTLKFVSANCTITAGAALVLTNGAFTSGAGSLIEFIWDSTAAAWVETHRSSVQQFWSITKLTSKEDTNTISEIDLTNGELNIVAGRIPAGQTVEFMLIGDYLHNQNVVTNYTPRLYLGATVIAGGNTGPSLNGFQSANRQVWWCRGTIHAVSTSSQWTEAKLTFTGSQTVAAGSNATPINDVNMYGSSSVDTTIDELFKFTVVCSTNSSLEAMRLQYAWVGGRS